MNSSFDLFDLLWKQNHRTVWNPFLNGTKNKTLQPSTLLIFVGGDAEEDEFEKQMKPTDTVKLSKFLSKAGQVHRSAFGFIPSSSLMLIHSQNVKMCIVHLIILLLQTANEVAGR